MKNQTDFRVAQYMDISPGYRCQIFSAIKHVAANWIDRHTMPAFLYEWVRYRWEKRIRPVKNMNEELQKAGWSIVKLRTICSVCQGTGRSSNTCYHCNGTGSRASYPSGQSYTCPRCKGDKTYREKCNQCSKGKVETWDFDNVKPIITENW